MKENISSLFMVLLTTLFVGLKLTGNIDWSWWWVLSPVWVPLGFAVLLLIIVCGIFLIVGKK
jgi:hypothetical protein